MRIVVPLAIAASGVVSVSAQKSWGPIDALLGFASDRSVDFHASSQTNPYANDPTAIAVGLKHYRNMCLVCHGAPGLEPTEISQGLHPSPPNLASPDSQSMSDGELFWVIANGIGSTGMPSFEKADPTDVR